MIMHLGKFIKQLSILCFISFILLFSSFIKLYAEELDWIEVAHINSEKQYIDPHSIKYNNRGLLSVMTKYSEVNSEDQKITNSNSYLMAIDCENRLFSKLPVNGDLKQVKSWETPMKNKLIKKTIISTCSY